MSTVTAPDRLPITVVIAALNESPRIERAIASVPWAAEIIVADGGSTDDTVALAKAAGARIVVQKGPTIGAQRNAAIEVASQEWILALDADETATGELRDQLAEAIRSTTYSSYRVRRENSYLGKVMRYGRFGRDWHLCVYRCTCRYTDSYAHETLTNRGETGRLTGPIRHLPYEDLRQHTFKIVRYAAWAAHDRAGDGRGGRMIDVILRPPLRFLRDYIIYRGMLDGWRGVIACGMSAYSVFLRAAMIRALRGDRRR